MSDCDKFEKKVIGTVLGVWVAWVLGSLFVTGFVVYAIFHFLAKFW